MAPEQLRKPDWEAAPTGNATVFKVGKEMSDNVVYSPHCSAEQVWKEY